MGVGHGFSGSSGLGQGVGDAVGEGVGVCCGEPSERPAAAIDDPMTPRNKKAIQANVSKVLFNIQPPRFLEK